MATAVIVAQVNIDLEDAEQYPLPTEYTRGVATPWRVDGFTLDHPAGEFVRLQIVRDYEGGHRSSTDTIEGSPVVARADRLPAHLQPLLQSARRTLEVIRALETVTTQAVIR